MRSITVPGTLDSLAPIGKLVLSSASEVGFDKRRSYALRLAVDEIATNIILHGYEEAGLKGEISIRVDIDEQALTVTVEDVGAPYDPTTRPPPQEDDFDIPLEERQIGGWGVYLAIQSVDKFLYRRVDDHNRNIFVMNREVHGHLLVVDGRHAHRDALSRTLTDLGYTVATADDGERALSMLSRQKFDLLLIDVQAAKLDAAGVLERLKADNALRGIPVIVLARQGGNLLAENCIEHGADDYFPADVSLLVIKARVSTNLEKQRVHMAEAALKESEKIERDVQIGHQIQLSFLPEVLPQPAGWEIAACFKPAREVAGDFYDAFPLTHNRIAFFLGDVCDKGVGAALFMALFRSLLRAFAQQNYSSRLMDRIGDSQAPFSRSSLDQRRKSLPTIGTLALKNSIDLTNNYIANNHGQTNMFATVFFGVLDPETGTVMYVNGGHEPPVLYSDEGIRSRLAPTGPAVGMMADMEFEIQEAQIDPGETLLIYTDGVTDARNAEGAFFGEKRILDALKLPEPSAGRLLERIEGSLSVHIGAASQFDDITMLALRRSLVQESETQEH